MNYDIIKKIIKGVGNGDGTDFSMVAYTFDKNLIASCNFGSNFNCKVRIKNITCQFF